MTTQTEIKSGNITDTLNELYKIFHQLEKSLFEKPLEEPVILIQSTKRKVLGTCSVNKIWEKKSDEKQNRYEITIVAESLHRPVEEIVETLLHEMIHLYCSLNDINDTSNNFVYHNKKYKEEAENHGLEVTHQKTIGWAVTKLKPETLKLISTFDINEKAFDYYRKPTINSDKKKTPYFKYLCSDCGIKLSHYKKLHLKCGVCDKDLEVSES